MEKFEQLMVADNSVLVSLEEREFMEVHKHIVSCGELAGRYLFEMCREIKHMRDGKLYLAAGFEKFGDYTEKALKIKERQAYNYIKVVESYDEQFITENSEIGITKLALIASASQEVADAVIEEGKAAEMTVNELTARLKEQEKLLAEKEQQLSISADVLTDKDNRIIELEEELAAETGKNVEIPEAVDTSEFEDKIKELTSQLKAANENLEIANGKLADKEAQIKVLNAKKPKVITETVEKRVEVDNPETQKALEEAQKEADAAKADKEKAEAEAKKYQEELVSYKKTQEAVATFKIHAAALFETFELVMAAVMQIKESDAELAQKCVGKLQVFSENVINSLEVV